LLLRGRRGGAVVLQRGLDGAELLPALRGVLPDPRRGAALARAGRGARATALRQPAGLGALARRLLRAHRARPETAPALPAGPARPSRRTLQRPGREGRAQEVRSETAPARGHRTRARRREALATRLTVAATQPDRTSGAVERPR